MSSVCRVAVLGLVCLAAPCAELRVCADPNNLPFSNQSEQGFENALAQLVAHHLGRSLHYVWTPQRGRYLKKTLNAGRCDLFMGIASAMQGLQTTEPYYRSIYSFVFRKDLQPAIRSFDDPSLRKAKIGIHVMQNDDEAAPPARALVSRGLLGNISWYKMFPNFTRPNPSFGLMEAVERKDVDVAVAWGPLAGYYARHAATPLAVVPAPSQIDRSIPLAFDISMGVRVGETRLLKQLNALIRRREPEIRQLLERYGVPLVEGTRVQARVNR